MAEEEEDGGGEAHDCADGKVAAGSSVGKGNVGNVTVDERPCASKRACQE